MKGVELKKKMKFINKFLFKIDDIIGIICLSLLVLIVFINVVARYIFNYPLTWSDELATALLVWCIFIGSSVCEKYGAHISIDVFVDIIPRKLKVLFLLLGQVILIVILAYLIYLSLKFAVFAGVKRTPTLKIHYTLINISASLGFILMLIYKIKDFIKSISHYHNKKI